MPLVWDMTLKTICQIVLEEEETTLTFEKLTSDNFLIPVYG